MSLAEATRAAVRERPFLLAALRAGVVNYAAAARFLDVEGEREAVAAALRRYADELPEYGETERRARVRMKSGVGPVEEPATDALLSVGGTAIAPGAGSLTAVLATGAVGPDALAAVLERLAVEGVTVEAAGVAGDALVLAVDRREGASAVRAVEAALSAVPTDGESDSAV